MTFAVVFVLLSLFFFSFLVLLVGLSLASTFFASIGIFLSP